MTDATGALLRDRLNLSVSRETEERLELFAALLEKWNRKINLVSSRTIKEIWTRHIIDSAQLAQMVNAPNSWVDLGSGGGLPGVIVAAIFAETAPECRVTLVESDRRKSLFMSTAIREMGLTATVETRRIELPSAKRYEVVSARALAPLTDLLKYAETNVSIGGVCLFPKGRNAEVELTEALRNWHIDLDRIPSQTDPEAVILRIKEFSRVSKI